MYNVQCTCAIGELLIAYWLIQALSKSLGLSKAIIRCFQLLFDRIRNTQLYKIAIRMMCQIETYTEYKRVFFPHHRMLFCMKLSLCNTKEDVFHMWIC